MADGSPFAPIGASAPKPTAVDKLTAVMPVPADGPKPPSANPTLGLPAATWEYRDAAGALLGFVCRFNLPDGEKEFRPLVLFRLTGGGLTWRWQSWPTPRPLYGLDRLSARPLAPVVVCEGEKAADAAAQLLPDHVCICSPNGSKSAAKADWAPLRGRHVVVWPDADDAGESYASAVEREARTAGAHSVVVLQPPAGVAAGWDAADAVAGGWDGARASAFVSKPPSPASETEGAGGAGSRSSGARRTPKRDKLLAAVDDIDLWHGPNLEAFATFPVKGHRESWPVKSAAFSRWLAGTALDRLGEVPGTAQLGDTLRILEAKAINHGPRREPWLRVGGRDGKFYLDLGGPDWRVIEIGPHGWRELVEHDAPFVRTTGMQPLPTPEGGEGIERLRGFLNVASDDDFTLVCGWLVGALQPDGPFPVLVVGGEQGSGKSTFSRLIRSLVDPHDAADSGPPKDERDMMVLAAAGHCVSFDNLSKVEEWMSDALCRIATGGAFASRALHTDRELSIIRVQRPVILNGIPTLTRRPDLAERSVQVRLVPITETGRRTEQDLRAAWRREAPFILGALLDALSAALRRIDGVKLASSPRMADFARLVTAAEPGLGLDDGAFMRAYTANRTDVVENTIEADPVAIAILRFVESFGSQGFHGTASELMAGINGRADDETRRLHLWPKTVQGFGIQFDRLAPLIRAKGYAVEKHKSGIRTISIAPVARP